MDWLQLRSGSDIRGTAVGEGTVLTPFVAKKIGMAFAFMLSEKLRKPLSQITVAFGRDSRISGPELMQAAADGVARTGATVLDFGMCTTPAMYMSTITQGFEPDGSVMITASHHPWNKNGLKFFTREGGLEGKQVEKLLVSAQAMDPDSQLVTGHILSRPFLPVYMKQLEERIRSGLQSNAEYPLRNLHVVVDAGNGAGGFYEQLLKKLGADTEGSQFLDPDGYFPNHIPNPENANAMQSVSKAVTGVKADLGVIFDADCDRAAIVDADGKEINRNRLIALISSILLDEGPGQTIVTDSVTSSGLTAFIEEHGGTHYRYKRGYRNVIDEAIRLNNNGYSCPLAIETSGHAALRENHFLDDGMYLVTVLLIHAMKMKNQGRSIGELILSLKEPSEAAEIRITISDEDFKAKGNQAIQAVLDHSDAVAHWHVAPDNREGVRIYFDLNGIPNSGWFLLRLSVHDPVLPLNAESDVPGGVRLMLAELYEVLNNINGIDLSELRRLCN